MKDRTYIKELLEEKYHYYHAIDFIEQDPILIPHQFKQKEDIEISGFLTATISWGNRKSILKNAQTLMDAMDNEPFDFILNHSKKDLLRLQTFVHRTFNANDCFYFMKALKHIYKHHNGLEALFSSNLNTSEPFALKTSIAGFRGAFLELQHEVHVEKHISNPLTNSSAKRICMFLRWMVRQDSKKVDFGIWKSIQPSDLCLPLDVHTGNISRALGLTKRNQMDWKTVEEITSVLRTFDLKDPIKYDFALFGLGVNKALILT